MTFEERIAADQGLLQTLGISVQTAGSGNSSYNHNNDSSTSSASSGAASSWSLVLNVDAQRVNAGGMCHGGFLFALADTACAYALGDAGFRPATVDANITYLKPALLNDKVETDIDIIRLGRRQGVVDVRLRRVADAALLAVFRGTCANLD